MLAKHGVGEFLQQLRSASMRTSNSRRCRAKARTERKQKRALAEDLNNLLGQPAAYADRVQIENFNITVRAEKNVTQVTGFHLAPRSGGRRATCASQRLQIPGVPVWENLAAETSYANRNFFIKNLQLAPELVIEEAELRRLAARAGQGRDVSAGARLRRHRSSSRSAGSQLDKKGENLDEEL